MIDFRLVEEHKTLTVKSVCRTAKKKLRFRPKASTGDHGSVQKRLTSFIFRRIHSECFIKSYSYIVHNLHNVNFYKIFSKSQHVRNAYKVFV